MLVEKKWMGTRNTYWHTYVQSNSKSKWNSYHIPLVLSKNKSKLMIDELVASFKVLRQIYGDKFWSAPELTPQLVEKKWMAHGTHTGTLTCRVTPKVNVFELLSHPASWHSQVIQKTSIKWTSSWPFFWLTLWLCGIVSHLNTFILLWCVGLFANCGVMTCHTFKVLRQIYGDKFWSAPELTPQKSLRLAPSVCLATVAWGACIVQGPSW